MQLVGVDGGYIMQRTVKTTDLNWTSRPIVCLMVFGQEKHFEVKENSFA